MYIIYMVPTYVSVDEIQEAGNKVLGDSSKKKCVMTVCDFSMWFQHVISSPRRARKVGDEQLVTQHVKQHVMPLLPPMLLGHALPYAPDSLFLILELFQLD